MTPGGDGGICIPDNRMPRDLFGTSMEGATFRRNTEFISWRIVTALTAAADSLALDARPCHAVDVDALVTGKMTPEGMAGRPTFLPAEFDFRGRGS